MQISHAIFTGAYILACYIDVDFRSVTIRFVEVIQIAFREIRNRQILDSGADERIAVAAYLPERISENEILKMRCSDEGRKSDCESFLGKSIALVCAAHSIRYKCRIVEILWLSKAVQSDTFLISAVIRVAGIDREPCQR